METKKPKRNLVELLDVDLSINDENMNEVTMAEVTMNEGTINDENMFGFEDCQTLNVKTVIVERAPEPQFKPTQIIVSPPVEKKNEKKADEPEMELPMNMLEHNVINSIVENIIKSAVQIQHICTLSEPEKEFLILQEWNLCLEFLPKFTFGLRNNMGM